MPAPAHRNCRLPGNTRAATQLGQLRDTNWRDNHNTRDTNCRDTKCRDTNWRINHNPRDTWWTTGTESEGNK